MRQVLLRALLHLVIAVMGFLCAAAVFLTAADRIATQEPSCLILNTGCWIAFGWAYNEPAAANPVVADLACLPSNTMNFVWCNEYEGVHRPVFANFGRGGGFDGHLISIYQAAANPSVKTLVYCNAPGALHNFIYPETTLLVLVTLERIRQEYPETAADVDTYLGHLYGSAGYQLALAELGPDWRRRVDPETLTFPSASPLSNSEKNQHPQTSMSTAFTRRAFALYDWSSDRLAHIPLLREPRPRLSPAFEKNDRLVELLDGCSARYRHPGNEKWVRRLMKKEDFWAGSAGGDVWHAWVRIVARICQARGIRFVYYIFPHIHITPAEYYEGFKPGYVDRVKEAFSPYAHTVVIDHSLAPGFNAADLAWFNNEKGVPIKFGYLFNAVGRLKESRLLLSSLLEAGALDGAGAPCRYLGSAWPGERRLPPGPSTMPYAPVDKTFLVQEPILEPRFRLRSQPAMPSQRAQK